MTNFTRGESVVKQSNTVALDFGRALFGPLGAVVFSAIVAISCFGALNGTLNLLSTFSFGAYINFIFSLFFHGSWILYISPFGSSGQQGEMASVGL